MVVLCLQQKLGRLGEESLGQLVEQQVAGQQEVGQVEHHLGQQLPGLEEEQVAGGGSDEVAGGPQQQLQGARLGLLVDFVHAGGGDLRQAPDVGRELEAGRRLRVGFARRSSAGPA